MNSRYIHIDWYFKVLLLALLLGLGVDNGLFSKPKVFRNKNIVNCYGFFLQII